MSKISFIDLVPHSVVAQALTIGPDRTTITLLYLSLAVSIATALVALWCLRRNAQLRRALCDLAEKTGQSPPKFRNRWFPRLRLRSLLLLVTLLAIACGFFGKELMRAKRQDEIIERLHMADEDRAEVNVHYDLGWIGQSVMARVMRDLVHPSFGYRVNQLQIRVEPLGDFYDSGVEPWTDSQDFRKIGHFTELEALQISGLSLSTETVDAIASLEKLKRVSLIHCRLPKGTVGAITKLPLLEDLELSHCELTNEDVVGIKGARRLTRLSLDGNQLSDGALTSIGTLKNLRYLDLTSNKLTGTRFRDLEGLSQLETLSLATNNLETKSLGELARHGQVRKIYLYGAFAEDLSRLYVREVVESVWPEDRRTVLNYDELPESGAWGIYDNRPVARPLPVSGVGTGAGGQGGGAF